jgi:hypothetical protein
MVAVLVTVIVGEPEETDRLRTLPTGETNVQFVLAGVAGLPNKMFPRLCEASSVTVRLLEMLTVLKSAVASVPSATTPLSQLVLTLQALVALFVQVPLAAWLTTKLAIKAAPADSRNDFFIMDFLVG